MRPVWRDIEALDHKIDAAVQMDMAHELEMLVERMTIWFLNNARRPLDIASTIDRYAPGIRELVDNLPEIVAKVDRIGIENETQRLVDLKVPKALARKVASLQVLAAGGDVTQISRDSSVPVLDTGRVYFDLGSRLGIDWLRNAARLVEPASDWERLAVESIIDDSYGHQSALTNRVLDVAGGGKLGSKAAEGVISTWIESRNGAVERTLQLLDELRESETVDLAMLTVANGQLRGLLAQ